MTIPQMLENIAEDICINYCKYPNNYMQAIKDVDEAMEKMQTEKCEYCPLQQIT